MPNRHPHLILFLGMIFLASLVGCGGGSKPGPDHGGDPVASHDPPSGGFANEAPAAAGSPPGADGNSDEPAESGPAWLRSEDFDVFLAGFNRATLRWREIDDEKMDLIVRAFQREGWNDENRVSLLARRFDEWFAEESASRAVELAEKSMNPQLIGFLLSRRPDGFDGAAQEHLERAEELMWELLSRQPVLETSMGMDRYFTVSTLAQKWLARIEEVAANPQTVYQCLAVEALLKSDFDKYFSLLAPGFADLTPEAKVCFSLETVGRSGDLPAREEHLKHLLSLVQLGDGDAPQGTSIYRRKSIEYVVKTTMFQLDQRIADDSNRERVEAAIVRGLQQLVTKNDDDARQEFFAFRKGRRAFLRKYVERVPEIMPWGAAAQEDLALSLYFEAAAELGDEGARRLALEILQANDTRRAWAALEGLADYGRGEDADLIAPYCHQYRFALAAIDALTELDPLPVRHLAKQLDNELSFVRSGAFISLRRKFKWDGIEFNSSLQGDEHARQKERIVDWLKARGHLP